MKVKVLNRKNAIELTKNDYKTDKVIISIRTIGDQKPDFDLNNNSIKDILYLEFNDWDDGAPDCINEQQAQEIAEFAEKYHDKVELIVVHCDGGVSRSAGCGAAILKYYTGDDSLIFDYSAYRPNMLVYRLVLEALNKIKK